jgi:hypothetical protein
LYVDNAGSYASTTVYVWYKGDMEVLRGAGLSSYVASSAGKYKVLIYEANGCSGLSNVIELTQGSGTGIEQPVIESESGSYVICGDEGSVMLKLTTQYTGTDIKYQWFKGDTLIVNANSIQYNATESGTYSILVSVDKCSSRSERKTVTKDASGTMTVPVLKSEGDVSSFCQGSDVKLYVENAVDYGSDAMYVWHKDGIEIYRQQGLDSIFVNTVGSYNVFVYKSDGCFAISKDTLQFTMVDSISMDTIVADASLPLPYPNDGTVLTVLNVKGGSTPYVYDWYKRSEHSSVWIPVDATTNPMSTGKIEVPTWYKVVVSSSPLWSSCNVLIDSIFISVDQIELKLEFLDTVYSICNTLADSIRMNVSNSNHGDATNVLIEFKSDGTLPAIGSISLPVIKGYSDTTIVIGLPENTASTAQTGNIKAEIVSCDQNDTNPSTVYGSWKNAGWGGNPSQADEDMLNLTLYPNLRLISKLEDTVCSGDTFTYSPKANLDAVTVSWVRYAVAGIKEHYSTGTGQINEVLTNEFDYPLTVIYTITVETEYCPTQITETLKVVVQPKGRLTLSHSPQDGSKLVLGTPVTITATLDGTIAKEYIFDYANNVSRQTHNTYEIFLFNGGKRNEVNVSVENEYGCILTGKETFMVEYSLPNTITPKEDKNNKLLPGYDIHVFNRWGSQLYRGTDGWDGKYKGSFVASGTYLYVVNIPQPDGKILKLKNSVFVKY